MPRGSAITVQPDIFKSIKEKEVKKSAEETPTLWTPGTDKRFFLQGIILSKNTTAGYWEFFDEAAEIFGMNVLAITTGVPLVIKFPVGYESIQKANKLILKTSATTASVSLVVFGTEVG